MLTATAGATRDYCPFPLTLIAKESKVRLKKLMSSLCYEYIGALQR